MTQTLAAFSTAISQLVASAAPLLGAIRIGPNRHVTGLVCQDNTIVTIDQALPALENYTVVLSNRMVVTARPGPRDPGSNLAVLRLESPRLAVSPEITRLAIASPAVGNVVVVLGADADASPMVRLTVIHRFIHTANGLAPVLDLSGERVDQGGLVLDTDGCLIGLAALRPNGEAIAIASVLMGRGLIPNQSKPIATTTITSRRAWLGLALQPITIPDQLMARTGQSSGRMVVSITKGGPADVAGLRIGDVVLALDGTSASGPQALRAFLSGDRIGSSVEIKLLREGNVVTTNLTLAAQPS